MDKWPTLGPHLPPPRLVLAARQPLREHGPEPRSVTRSRRTGLARPHGCSGSEAATVSTPFVALFATAPGLDRGPASAPAGQRLRWRPMRRAARWSPGLLPQAASSSAGGGGPHSEMSRTRRVAPVCSQRPLSTSSLHRRSISFSASHAAASCSRSRLKIRLSAAWRMRSCSPITSLLGPKSFRVRITRRYACARSRVISELSHGAGSHPRMMTTGNASAFSPMPKDLRAAFGRKARSTGPGSKLTRGRLLCRRIRGETFPRRSGPTTRGSVIRRCEQVRDADRSTATRSRSSQLRDRSRRQPRARPRTRRYVVARAEQTSTRRLHRRSHKSNDRSARRRDGDRRGRSNLRRRVSAVSWPHSSSAPAPQKPAGRMSSMGSITPPADQTSAGRTGSAGVGVRAFA